ncbi:ABC transporter ATP-binding protein [Ruminococcus sp.]|uniref:ABC transporter ATP-binding protein n=1 Tax=Ruminococcus sp. TaxID=41978 RepID=UPI0025D11354|nr:ABC transporter ATP-binding protein [Ruminococcus sp.]MBQ8967828.1 ABC transporter ATP-binding protein [Ruminococcus sp.]
MENIILQTNGLSVKYGSFTALDNVSICLKEKHIYGFIGENGAGKTTLMKVLTGLIYPTSGDFSLFGKNDEKDIMKMRRRIGSTIEAPTLYPNYTAYQNLELQRVLIGNPDKGVCDRLLELVGLKDVRSKKVKKFSMGMKQRLGIALALVGKPELLILDEPINGLDPKNISELRVLLKRLNEENDVTLFISSHILNELYLLATDYYIIHRGRMIESLTHDELDAKCRQYIKIKTAELPRCITVIENGLDEPEYKVIDDETMQLFSHTDKAEAVAKLLMENMIVTREFSVTEQSLEEYFLRLTGGAENV